MSKGITGNRLQFVWLNSRCFSVTEGNSTNMCIHAFHFSLLKHREPQPSNDNLPLPIIPIGIVAYAFTLWWDNLCRNSYWLYKHQWNTRWAFARKHDIFTRENNTLFHTWKYHVVFTSLKVVWYLKYGDVHEKCNFLKIPDLRPLNTCQKHFETILPNFPPDECEM